MEDLMTEAKPVFNHKSMLETVSNVLVNAGDELRAEDKTSLIASVTEPSPPVTDWPEYLGWAVEASLPDAVYTCMQDSMNDSDVVLFALHAFDTWMKKEDDRMTVEIHALRNLSTMLLRACSLHSKNLILLSKALGLFCTLPDELLMDDKDQVLTLFGDLAGVMESAHANGTHQMWQMGSIGVARLLSILAFKGQEWFGDDTTLFLGCAERLLKLVEQNSGHWEVFYILQVLVSFRKILSDHAVICIRACSKVILSHTKNGTECVDRKVCDPDYTQTVGWGTTMDLCLQILSGLCFKLDRSGDDFMKVVTISGRAMLNCYTAGRKYLDEARSFLELENIEKMCDSGAARACIEIVLSHSGYRQLMSKALQLMIILTYSPESFPIDDLYRKGAGAFALLEMIVAQRTRGLGNKELTDAEEDHISNAAALLMMVTGERRYKMGILGRGYEQLWALLHNPDTLFLGLSVFCYLSKGSPDAQEWLRKKGADEGVVNLFREPSELTMFKMGLDVLTEMQSPMLMKLPEFLGSFGQLVSVVFYYTPKLSDTELTMDNSPMICSVLKCITQSVINADRVSESKGNNLAEELAECGYAFTLIQTLWFLEPESEIWKEAAVAGFYYFKWESETPLETVHKWLLHVRRTAEDLDPNAKEYRKILRKNPDIEKESFSGPRNAFFENLCIPGLNKRKIALKAQHSEPPRNDLVVMEKKVKAKEPTAKEVALAKGEKACDYCGRVPGSHMGQRLLRCARCKTTRYCSRDCQASHWRAGHSSSCVKID